MKTKSNWVIKTSAGGYWCGNAHFDPQIRKVRAYEKLKEKWGVSKNGRH